MKTGLIYGFFCLFSLTCFGQDNLLYSVKKHPLSTDQFHEYAPCQIGSKTAYCSNQPCFGPLDYKTKTGRDLDKIFVFDSTNQSVMPYLKKDLVKASVGPYGMSATGSLLIYSLDQAFQNTGSETYGLYFSHKHEKWGDLIPFEHNSKAYSLAHPSLNSSGTRLYFSSDMPGGFGGADIYFSDMKDGRWTKPQNAGPNVNSVHDEKFPFIHNNGTLYFASNRPEGLGGLDIFYAPALYNQTLPAVHLPEPVNSTSDDFSFNSFSDVDFYFSSNRDGTDDVFTGEFLFPTFECDSLYEKKRCFVFYETSTFEVSDMPLKFQWNMGDGTLINRLEADHCFSDTGLYTIELNIIDTLTNDVYFIQASYDFLLQDSTQVVFELNDTLKTGERFELNAFNSNLPEGQIDYYWNFGDGHFVVGNRSEHIYTLAGDYLVEVGAVVKTDSSIRKFCTYQSVHVTENPGCKSTTILNYEDGQKLSQKRNTEYGHVNPGDETEKNYQVEIIKTKDQIGKEAGYFDQVPGDYLVEEHYSYTDSCWSYTIGNENSVEATFPIYRELKHEGYSDSKVMAVNTRIITLEELPFVEKQDLEYATLRIPNLQFDYNSFKIHPDAYSTLEKVLAFMKKFPEIQIEIGAHTDNKGDNNYNLQLSDKRAQAIKNYFTDKGISSERLSTIGFGEARPIASNETDRGQRTNRRIEFRLIH